MKAWIETYHALSDRRKLLLILLLGGVFRLLAVFFSQGYAMHDDHILVVEKPGAWAYGYDPGSYFPYAQHREIEQGIREHLQPEGHSMLYFSAQFVTFKTLKTLGINHPSTQMLVVRFLHGLLGVLLIYLTYVLAKQFTNAATARQIAWVAALGWAFSFLSVRNLVEIVCIPFLLSALTLSIRGLKKNAIQLGIWAGVLMAFAVSIRYQTVVFLGVFGLMLLFQKAWKLSAAIFLSFCVSFFLIQGLPDWLIWGKPFAEMLTYFGYNMSEARFDYASDLGDTNKMNYIAILAFITIPIVGIFWLFGFLRTRKKIHLLFVPSLVFILFHMSYVNIQERFIFPIVHIVLILGIIGWNEFRNNSNWWVKRQSFWKGIQVFGWSINFVLLLVFSTYFGKKSRVTSVEELYANKHVSLIIQENTFDGYTPFMPLFYAQRWDLPVHQIKEDAAYDEFKSLIESNDTWFYFQGEENLEERIELAKKHFPNLRQIGTFKASFLDRIIQKINPVNRNESIVVYEVLKD